MNMVTEAQELLERTVPWQQHAHIERGTGIDLVKLALTGLLAIPNLTIVLACKSREELDSYASMLIGGMPSLEKTQCSYGMFRLSTCTGKQSVDLVLLSDNGYERLAGYCRDYIWFMGMCEHFDSKAFEIMYASLADEHSAIITFGSAADRAFDVGAVR